MSSLVVTGLAAWGGPALIADAATPPPVIPRAAKSPTADGKLDEAEWARGLEVRVNLVCGKGEERATGRRMTAGLLWDDLYLYVGYEIWDANIAARSEGQPQGPKENVRQGCDIAPEFDVVEFFLVFDDPNFFWESHHNALNDFGDLLCLAALPAWQKSSPAQAGAGIYFGREEYVQDHGEATLQRAVALKPRQDGKRSTVSDPSDTDTGYTCELRLPWFGIGAAAVQMVELEPARDGKPAARVPRWNMDGREISILAVSQNGDFAGRYCTSAAGLAPGEFFHKQTGNYPRYATPRSPWPHDPEERSSRRRSSRATRPPVDLGPIFVTALRRNAAPRKTPCSG